MGLDLKVNVERRRTLRGERMEGSVPPAETAGH